MIVQGSSPVACNRTAPAPSAKIVDVRLSSQSIYLLIAYVPITRIFLYCESAMMNFVAVSSAVTKPAHAQLTSKVAACFARKRLCTTDAVAGEIYSGVSVATIIKSISSGST